MATGYHDFTAGEVPSAATLEDYLMLQANMTFADAAARNSQLAAVLREGLMAFLQDINCWTVYTGGAWSTVGPVHGAPTGWTPAVTQGAAVSTTNTASFYSRLGRWIQATFDLTCTTSGTAGQPILISLPVAAVAAANHPVGSITVLVGGATGHSRLIVNTSTTVGVVNDSNANLGVAGGGAVQLVNTNVLRGTVTYYASGDA